MRILCHEWIIMICLYLHGKFMHYDMIMIILMKECIIAYEWRKYIYEIPSLRGSYLDPSLWRQLKDKMWVPSLGGSYMSPSLWRQLKRYNMGPFTRRQLHIRSLPMKAAKTFETLYLGGTWLPLQVSTVWR